MSEAAAQVRPGVYVITPEWARAARDIVEAFERRRVGTMGAPDNPYRVDSEQSALRTDAMWGPVERGDPGPGLLGADIDHIARRAHRDGYVLAETQALGVEAKLKGERAGIYDEGYDAGRRAGEDELTKNLRHVLGVAFGATIAHDNVRHNAKDAAERRERYMREAFGALRVAYELLAQEEELIAARDYMPEPLDEMGGLAALRHVVAMARDRLDGS